MYIDFSQDIYDKIITVEPLVFMRDVEAFSSLQELKKQIQYDLIQAKKYVKEFS